MISKAHRVPPGTLRDGVGRQGSRCAAQQNLSANVADWSFAASLACEAHVRFASNSGWIPDICERPLCATSGHREFPLGAAAVLRKADTVFGPTAALGRAQPDYENDDGRMLLARVRWCLRDALGNFDPGQFFSAPDMHLGRDPTRVVERAGLNERDRAVCRLD